MKLQFKLCPKEFNRRLGLGTKIAISDDSTMIAFSDKENSVCLYHKPTHRVVELYKGEHSVSQLLFTKEHLVASE